MHSHDSDELLLLLQDACNEVGRLRYEMRSAVRIYEDNVTKRYGDVCGIPMEVIKTCGKQSRKRFTIPDFLEVLDDKRVP